jgi:hypothetical protein
LGILETHGDQLDLAYVERWIEVLKLTEVWDVVRNLREE